MTGRYDTIRVVGTARAALGESPVWDAGEQRLLWLDILGQQLLRTDPATGATEAVALDRRPGSIALSDGDELLLAAGHELLARRPDGALRRIAQLPAGEPGRCNDGKPDAMGRFWVGTASRNGAPEGALYRVAPGATPLAMVAGVRMSNGLGWSADNRIFYHVDTGARRLDAFDFDLETGALAARRTVLELPAGQLPDGLTVDAEGRIWLAVWGAAAVLVLSPAGAIVATVELPTSRVSSCTFGGADLKMLFVTTAQEGMTEAEIAADPLAGALFAVETDTPGLLPNRVRLS
jgi:sugar lactone lactonase YvrE